MKRLSAMVLPAILGVLALGCFPAGPEFIEDLDVVYTSFDEDFNFQSRGTYAMPDQIVIDVEIDRNGDTTYVYMKDVFANQILATIDQNMSSNGWSKVDIDDTPDVVVTPAGIKSTTYYYSYWYNWWYGGFYPGWGWYYPPSYTVSSVSTGTMLITIADPNVENDSPINQSEVAWLAAANGILTSNFDVARVNQGINQAFAQSPYLKRN